MSQVVFLHGLESHTAPDGIPMGRKARFLDDQFAASLPALDTRVAREIAARTPDGATWTFPYDGYEDAFATPVARARAAITPATKVLIGSSFGGAVAMRLLHEEPRFEGVVIFLASAARKLTPYRHLPSHLPVLLVHGIHDDVVSPKDSVALAGTSDRARLHLVDDDHRLASIVREDQLGRWVRAALTGHMAGWPDQDA